MFFVNLRNKLNTAEISKITDQVSDQDNDPDTVQEKITARIPEFCVVPRRRYYSAIRQYVIPIAIALFHKIDILLIMMETITRDS